MLARRSDILVVALLAFLVGAACRPHGDAPLPSTDDVLGSLALPGAGGGPAYDPKQLAGKVVLINFWSPT